MSANSTLEQKLKPHEHGDAAVELEDQPVLADSKARQLAINGLNGKREKKRSVESETDQAPFKDGYHVMGELFPEEFFAQRVRDEEAKLEQNPRLKQIVELLDREFALQPSRAEAQETGNVEVLAQVRAQAQSVWQELKQYSYDELDEVSHIRSRISAAEGHYVNLDSNDHAAQLLLQALEPAKPVNHVGQSLSDRNFFRPSAIREEALKVDINADDGRLFDVPLGLLVYAGAFSSWEGRGPNGSSIKEYDDDYSNSAKTSHEVIHEYAALSTELPPVDKVEVYVQPDGRIFCSVPRDAHRTAAAMLRGQHTLKAKSLMFIKLDNNVLD